VITQPCPKCADPAAYSKKRERYFCAECELEFDAHVQAVEPQTIFLSYAHRSEREEDFDLSEELVKLIQQELQRDGHTVWIDKDGIRAGSQWRERITSAILEHAHFLSFLSTRSVRDPGVCLNEISIALGHGKNIQTVLVQDESRVAPPLTISHIQWHDFQEWHEIRSGAKKGPMGEDWEAWFGQRIARVQEALTDVQNARVNGDLQKLRDILDPKSFEARIVEKTFNFHGRQWLFDAAHDWLDNSNSRMFWLKGGPGIGKSAFAAMLAHKARSAVIGFFMCDFQGRKDPEESAREATCTLAFQIASRLPDYRIKLLYQLQVDKDKIDKRSADDLFEYLIIEPLNSAGKIPESTRLCLVIDALDEAGRSGGGNALAQLLAKHVDRLPVWLGVLVTSRPEPYLEQMLSTLSGTSVDGQSAHNQQDLAEWIDQRLVPTLKGDERQLVIDEVLEKCGGTFLYLSLIERDKTLSLADPKNLPDKLDGFFMQTFNRYFPSIEQYNKKTEPFLGLMAAAPGPLPSEMGRQVLGWSQRDLALNLVEPMGSLLHLQDGGLVFFHASLADWLKEPQRSGVFCVDKKGHQRLGEFIWNEFQRSTQTDWQKQVIDWLAYLLPSIDPWIDANSVSKAATFLESHRRFMSARSLRRQALKLQKPDTEAQADALEALAANYTESAIGDQGRSNFDHSIELLGAAWNLRKRYLGENHPQTLMTLAKIPYGEAGLYTEGLQALEYVLKNAEALPPKELCKVQAHHAYYLYENGEFEASREIYRQLLQSCEPGTVERVIALSLLGFIEYELGHWEASKFFSEQALKDLDSVTAEFSSTHLIATIHLNLSMSMSSLGIHDQALKTTELAQAGFAESMDDSYPWWGAIWVDIGLVYLAASKDDAASQHADKAAMVSESLIGDKHFEPTCAWMLQAWIKLRNGDGNGAQQIIEKSLHVRKQTLPPAHWRILTCQENLAHIYRLLGQTNQSDGIALRWDEELSDHFAFTLSMEAATRISCRMAMASWRAGHKNRARLRILAAIERCSREKRLDLVGRLQGVVTLMTKEIERGR
jgi:tetratricopeptide (TPR) repeat protein